MLEDGDDGRARPRPRAGARTTEARTSKVSRRSSFATCAIPALRARQGSAARAPHRAGLRRRRAGAEDPERDRADERALADERPARTTSRGRFPRAFLEEGGRADRRLRRRRRPYLVLFGALVVLVVELALRLAPRAPLRLPRAPPARQPRLPGLRAPARPDGRRRDAPRHRGVAGSQGERAVHRRSLGRSPGDGRRQEGLHPRVAGIPRARRRAVRSSSRTSRRGRRRCASSSRTTSGSTPTPTISSPPTRRSTIRSRFAAASSRICSTTIPRRRTRPLLPPRAPDLGHKPRRDGRVSSRPPDGDAPPPTDEKKPALGLDEYRDRWQARANKHDDFPTGYFATTDGDDDGHSDRVARDGHGRQRRRRAPREDEGRRPGSSIRRTTTPAMKVGFAGDIPNAIEEKDSLVSDAAWATGIAFVLILGGVVFFFRSPWSLVVISLPAFIGVGCAYSFAMATYGYVNTSGAFLGAIILGNGINYPIVLLVAVPRVPRARAGAGRGAARRRVERLPRRARGRDGRQHRVRIARHHALPGLQPVRDDRLRRDAARVGLDDPVRARRSSSSSSGIQAKLPVYLRDRSAEDREGRQSRPVDEAHRRRHRATSRRLPRDRGRADARARRSEAARITCATRGSTTSTSSARAAPSTAGQGSGRTRRRRSSAER